jgi:hypothetical protein
MPEKPPLPTKWGEPLPLIEVDESEGGTFSGVLRVAQIAADKWARGPGALSMTHSEETRGTVREALLYLLELGVIDIDEERFNAVPLFPVGRERDRG